MLVLTPLLLLLLLDVGMGTIDDDEGEVCMCVGGDGVDVGDDGGANEAKVDEAEICGWICVIFLFFFFFNFA